MCMCFCVIKYVRLNGRPQKNISVLNLNLALIIREYQHWSLQGGSVLVLSWLRAIKNSRKRKHKKWYINILLVWNKSLPYNTPKYDVGDWPSSALSFSWSYLSNSISCLITSIGQIWSISVKIETCICLRGGILLLVRWIRHVYSYNHSVLGQLIDILFGLK